MLVVPIAVVAIGLLAGVGWFAFRWWIGDLSSEESRVVISPWVNLAELQESDEVIFEAVMDEPARWRLAVAR